MTDAVVTAAIVLAAAIDIAVIVGIIRLAHGEPPFISTPAKDIAAIVDAFALSPGDTLYDLGCGDARLLVAAAKRYPQTHFVGIEKRLLVSLRARIRSRGMSNVRIRRDDFMTTNFSDATHVFAFLFPEVMARLRPRFEHDLTPGTMLFSLDFKLPGHTPEKELSLPGFMHLGTKLYSYRLRGGQGGI